MKILIASMFTLSFLLIQSPAAKAGNIVINNATGAVLWVSTYNYYSVCVEADSAGTSCARWQSFWSNAGWWELKPDQLHNMTFNDGACVALQDPSGQDVIAKLVTAGTTFNQTIGGMWVHPSRAFSLRMSREPDNKVTITSVQIGDTAQTPPAGALSWNDVATALTGFGMANVDCLEFEHDGFVKITPIPSP